jgi:hypothetical protein
MTHSDREFGLAWGHHQLRYLLLAPLAATGAILFGPRDNWALLAIVAIEYVFIVYLLVALMTAFLRYGRKETWDESLKHGFWTGIVWIVLLAVVHR